MDRWWGNFYGYACTKPHKTFLQGKIDFCYGEMVVSLFEWRNQKQKKKIYENQDK